MHLIKTKCTLCTQKMRHAKNLNEPEHISSLFYTKTIITLSIMLYYPMHHALLPYASCMND